MYKVIKILAQTPGIKYGVRFLMRFAVSKKADNISHHFSQFLSPKIAANDELRDEVYKIRHNVYCKELAFEDVKPSGKEMDDFDKHSLHCVLQHVPSGEYAGTVRVVRSNHTGELLPIEKYCLKNISYDEVHPGDFPREKICEISRLAVPAQFRRRQADKFNGAERGIINETTYSEEELRCFPFIAVGLYLSAASMVIHEKIDHVFVMMEPRLAKSLRFVGIKFRQIGPVVEYHGQRAPYYITPEMLKKGLPPGFLSLMNNIDDSLDEQFAAMENANNQTINPTNRNKKRRTFDEDIYAALKNDEWMRNAIRIARAFQPASC